MKWQQCQRSKVIQHHCLLGQRVNTELFQTCFFSKVSTLSRCVVGIPTCVYFYINIYIYTNIHLHTYKQQVSMAQALDQTHQTLAGSCGRPCQLDPGLKYINKYLMCCCKILHFHVEGQKLITRTFLFPSHHRGVNICLGKWSSG